MGNLSVMRRRLLVGSLALACLASVSPSPAVQATQARGMALGSDHDLDRILAAVAKLTTADIPPSLMTPTADASRLADARQELGLEDPSLDGWLATLGLEQRLAITDLIVAVADATHAVRTALRHPLSLSGRGSTPDTARAAITAAGVEVVRQVAAARSPLATLRSAEATCFGDNILCIGSDGNDRWEEDVQILIDPDGDDTYLNNAGGTLNETIFPAAAGCTFGGGNTGRAAPNLECTAAPSQVCTYDTANAATQRDDLPIVGIPGHTDPDEGDRDSGSCGSDERLERTLAGAAGTPTDPDGRTVSVALDLNGDDTYLSKWRHDDPLFGLIEDCFPGDDSKVNTNRDFVQGAALGGIGLLWDDGEGDDIYRGRLNSQGSGHVGGFGALVTTGRGDASFWADRLSQGNGIAGGVGMLVNLKDGEQSYLLDPPVVYRNEFSPSARGCQQEGRAGQGQGGFGGVGVLATLGGSSSTYRAVAHVTEEAFPFSPVLDGQGRPKLVAGTDAQGSGESFPITATMGGVVLGVGLLVDDTTGDTRTCKTHPRAGMLAGSTTSVGEDLSTMGSPDRSCGKFNTDAELDPISSLDGAIARLVGGAVGVRVVL
jgi:hypothetical protein